jgi:hypothetical protein
MQSQRVGHVAHLLTALPAVWVCTRFPVEACRVVEGLGFPALSVVAWRDAGAVITTCCFVLSCSISYLLEEIHKRGQCP